MTLRKFLPGFAAGILAAALFALYAFRFSLAPSARAVVGTLDISGTSQSLTGDVTAARIVDAANSAYFIDPAASGTSMSLAGAASISGSLTLPQGAAMRPAFGPTTLSYKSGFDAWGTGLTIQDGTGNVGIGTANPGAKLEVAGQVKITGGTPGADKVLTSDGAGLATWETPSGVPAGVIVMWSGLLANIPTGWALCDGTNGTPDLRDRFIYGASAGENPGTTGGANSYSLTTANLPNHTHGITADGAHSHNLARGAAGGVGSNYVSVSAGTYDPNNWWGGLVSSYGAHSHGGATGGTGSGTAIDNRPSYYTLAFIMKL